MKLKLLVLAWLLAAMAGPAYSQLGGGGYPFDTPADPRSVAMGESFVAVASNPAALMYNPAGLAGLTGLNLSYSRKSLDWFLKGWSVSSVNATAGTSLGVFAAQYNRKSMGTIPVTTEYFPDGNGSEYTLYAHDIAFGYAYRLPVGLALGASAKYYDFVERISGPLNGGPAPWTSTPAYLFDFGLTYTLPRLHAQESVEDSITVGICYQNIGSRWKYAYPPYTDQIVLVGYSWAPTEFQMPEYFRIGLSYALRLRPAKEEGLSPFAALVSGEFRSLQAPLQVPYSLYSSIPQVPPETSFWGIGIELTVYEFLTVRGGAAFRPYSDVEGDKDRASFRYGAGLRIPFQKIGLGLPLVLSFQYTVIPVSFPTPQTGPYFVTQPAGPAFFEDTEVSSGTYPLISLEIQYTGVPW